MDWRLSLVSITQRHRSGPIVAPARVRSVAALSSAAGGRRPWFLCSVYSNDQYCGRRAAVLYGAGELFACRRCYGLAYESQQGTPRQRGVGQAQKIRTRLGGTVNLFEPFPEKPKRMHWRTYLRLRARGEAAEHYSNELTMQLLNRLKRSR